MKSNFSKLSTTALIATLSFSGLTTAAPLTGNYSVHHNTTLPTHNIYRPTVIASTYQCFSGSNDAYPTANTWIGFDAMWAQNENSIRNSCANMASWGGLHASLPDPGAFLTDFQLGAMRAGVLEAASASGVPAEFIFAILLQESHGCPSVRTTNNGVINPGLMQCHNGHEFVGNHQSIDAQVASIKLMIAEGAMGTSFGDGLKQCMANQGGGVFAAARQYNSGSVANPWSLNEANGATASYVCDIANHLTGNYVWDGFVTLGCN